MRNLRAKLQEISQKRLVIATVPGEGYRFLFGDSVESRGSSTSEGPRLQYCRDVAGLQEFDFGTVQELDERPALGDLVGIAA